MTDKIKLKADKFVNDKKLKLNYIKPKDLKILLAEFCEEQIAELKARCNELFLQTCGQAEKIKELEAQIEKMKCCENCNNFMHRIDHRCNTKCKNLSEWEIKEK